VVDSTADFLNSAQLPPFVRVHQDYLLTKRLRAQFVVVRQFFPLVALQSLKTMSVKCAQ